MESKIGKLESIDQLFPVKYIQNFKDNYPSLPTIYVITPTYGKSTQFADLNRLKNTLLLVPKVFWIVIEDLSYKSGRLANFLNQSGLKYVHLNAKSPKLTRWKFRKFHKGSYQRNLALEWLRHNQIKKGVVYFADDDNSYDLNLFEEIRYTNKISVLPIGFVGGVLYERPICKNNKVIFYLV